ncbi:lysozyme inhibitor LprI family protein [Roseomonas marmotae]|uniref:DUF1311 domain-containing protein n=1 Tax=Roseomonas marmotae TaxID=2768161 RepID=A0ABS3K9X3_9PROT|nr:hypothetical protein [Roseomonas marmotae]MBO1074242.1 hypothetical protein [Roseomonas marmotae]QTI79005.1 hypothetical protein IAI58_15415 [Roseomonas marmotae]
MPEGAAADCARPSSRVEAVICADPGLRAADQALAGLVAQWRHVLPDGAALTAQQDWLRRRDLMCAPAMAVDCLRIAYAEREAYLRARLTAGPTPAPRPQPPPIPVTPPPGDVGAPLALRVARMACHLVSSDALRVMGWGRRDAPFGLPLEQWTRPDFSALIRRSEECQAANTDNPRNVQAMAAVLNRLRAMAPERGAVPAVISPPPPAAAPSAPARPKVPAAPQGPLDCGDAALLQDVSYTFQATPELSAGTRIHRMHDPRPYTDVILEAYGATPALRAEYERLKPYMAPVPQCLVNAETGAGEVVLSYRLYAEDGRTLVEVQRVP